ncbi:MAG: hypothetical protein NT084_15730 [Bacteroidetes bacterium]|nr:hypothetical protein [Bacteroidota bacterium]
MKFETRPGGVCLHNNVFIDETEVRNPWLVFRCVCEVKKELGSKY